jgi:hypothetical protein
MVIGNQAGKAGRAGRRKGEARRAGSGALSFCHFERMREIFPSFSVQDVAEPGNIFARFRFFRAFHAIPAGIPVIE